MTESSGPYGARFYDVGVEHGISYMLITHAVHFEWLQLTMTWAGSYKVSRILSNQRLALSLINFIEANERFRERHDPQTTTPTSTQRQERSQHD